MNLREMAQAANVSEAAVSKNKKIPRTRNDDGSLFFDPADPAVQAYLRRKPRQRKQAQATAAKKEAAPKPKKTKAKKEVEPALVVAKPVKRARQPRVSEDDLDLDDFEILTLDDVKIKEQILTSRHNRSERRKDLLPRETVLKWSKHFFDADTAALKIIPDRVGGNLAMMARAAETEEAAATMVRSMLAEEINKIIVGVKRVQKDFKRAIDQPAAYDMGAQLALAIDEQEAV